ncbi:hypothetical protein XA68_16418 [Ophiocordyceps unilateralis]|uniref:Uncharacterized protein n=1 Tax=Ophiocordyceps unilateralis TaxID=268505 RepID=A0A2A9P4Y3_OPHUN|nr:hypothetical protein XA68_16418 [Ophiocordyceps unilateralis]
MPLAHVVIAPGVVVAVSVTMAVAMALYGSPELRRYADDARRRIAMAVHSFGDNIDPYRHGEPRFNRPEDADGFMLSSRDPGVDGDDETLRRQREELMYWNRMRLEKSKAEKEAVRQVVDDDDVDSSSRPVVYGSGADARPATSGLRHRREASNLAPASAVYYANPFADEHAASDIYSATTRDAEDDFHSATLAPSPPAALIDLPPMPDSPSAAHRQESYASIQAWAQDSSNHNLLSSSLHANPAVAVPESEPDMLSDGQLTPTATDLSAPSLVGSAEHLSQPAEEDDDDEAGRPFDVLSESSGMDTPASWSELGSVVSENESLGPLQA